MRPIQPIAAASLSFFGLVLVVVDRFDPGDGFVFWAGAILIAFSMLTLTPFGERLR